MFCLDYKILFVSLSLIRNLKQSDMKKILLLITSLLLISISVASQSEFRPLAWDKCNNLWRSPYGKMPLANGDFLPYINKTAFFPVNGYNHCIMRVYDAKIKFGEFTPDDDPFLIYEIDYDNNGMVVHYSIEKKGSSPEKNDVELKWDGKKLLSEKHFNSKRNLIGTVIYKYDEYNRLSVIDLIGKDNKIFKKTRYSYTSSGNTKRIEYNWEGDEKCSSSDVKDSKGRLIKYTYNEGGSTIAESITYNDKGYIEKINSSKTFVFNGKKDEIYKGKLYDGYKYRYDDKGNITERLRYHIEFSNESLELIRCSYSNKRDNAEEKQIGNILSANSKNLLDSSDKDDYIANLTYSSMHIAGDETFHKIVEDIDNDGEKEGLYIMKNENDDGILLYGVKNNPYDEDNAILSRIDISLNKLTQGTCTTTILFHDFDNDGSYEVVFAFTDMGMVFGWVFRWLKINASSSMCLEEVGKFGSGIIPYIDGNSITTKVGLGESAIISKYSYRNNKLVKD